MIASEDGGQDRTRKRTKAHAAKGNGHAKGRRAKGGDGALKGLSKTELQKRAAEADISGRSKMSKEELISALQGAA